MQLNPLDPSGSAWNEAALHALGASTVSWPAGQGPVVDPAIDLTGYAAAATAQAQAALIAYANAKQWKIATGGHSVTIGGSSVRFATDETSYSLMTGKAARLQLSGAPATTNWQIADTTFVSIATADFIAAAANVADWMQSSWDVLEQVLAAISAGTITTTAAVDSPPSPIPAWPVNS